MPRTIVYDTEFLEDGKTIELISIGAVDTDGNEFYAINSQAPWNRIREHDWLVNNVIPSLPRIHGDRRNYLRKSNVLALDFDHPSFMTPARLRKQLLKYLAPTDNRDDLELWAYYCACDHVALAQLLGPRMIELPEGVPMFTHDIRQRWEDRGRPDKTPREDYSAHNALDGARRGMELLRICDDEPWTNR